MIIYHKANNFLIVLWAFVVIMAFNYVSFKVFANSPTDKVAYESYPVKVEGFEQVLMRDRLQILAEATIVSVSPAEIADGDYQYNLKIDYLSARPGEYPFKSIYTLYEFTIYSNYAKFKAGDRLMMILDFNWALSASNTSASDFLLDFRLMAKINKDDTITAFKRPDIPNYINVFKTYNGYTVEQVRNEYVQIKSQWSVTNYEYDQENAQWNDVRSGFPPALIPDDRLVFNHCTWYEPVFEETPYDFIHILSDEQLVAVFPNYFDYESVRARYLTDGTLVDVTAEGLVTLSPSKPVNNALFGFEGVPDVSEVQGVAVTVLVSGDESRGGYFQADFMLDDIYYLISLNHDMEYGKWFMTKLVNQIIFGGTADLSVLADPVVPELRSEWLSLDEARLDPDFGRYIPSDIPEGLELLHDAAHRIINNFQNGLYMDWNPVEIDPDRERRINWSIYKVDEEELSCVVSLEDWNDYSNINAPYFTGEELSLDVLTQVADFINWDESIPGWWSVTLRALYGEDTIVEIMTRGFSPEEVWKLISAIKESAHLAL